MQKLEEEFSLAAHTSHNLMQANSKGSTPMTPNDLLLSKGMHRWLRTHPTI